MQIYLVTFRFEGDSDTVIDSVWEMSNEAQQRVEELETIAAGIIDGIGWEPVTFNAPGYSAEELED